MIPKLIHQTWKTKILPKQTEALAHRWRELHPDYEYRLWTDDDCRDFVRTNHPDFYATYRAFPAEIQRVDAVRYLILKTYGGIYLDLDMFPLRKLEPLLTSNDFTTCYEPAVAAQRHHLDYIISNAAMVSPPAHPFLDRLIEEMKTYKSKRKNESDRILETTGPFLLSRAYRKNPQGVRLLHSQYFMPLYYDQIDELVNQSAGAEFLHRCHDAYGVHLFEGSWWRKDSRKPYAESLAVPPGASPIPRIIHQTWKSKDLPRRFEPLVERVRALHPGWELRLWTDEEMLAFVTEHGPQYLSKYKAYPHAIQRCDFFRLFVVAVLGGVYLDLDVQLTKSFNELPGFIEAFFPCEKVMSSAALIKHRNRDAMRIGNYAFGAAPNHPFLRYMLKRLQAAPLRGRSANDVLESTGPGILTTAYHDYARRQPQTKVAILHPDIGATAACGCASEAGVAACQVGSFGTHLHAGTWRENVLADELASSWWSWPLRWRSGKSVPKAA
jgi:mannosyltransferase OCH1-like enzyme